MAGLVSRLRRAPIVRLLASSRELDAYGRNVPAAWLDAYRLCPAIGRERDRGGKGGGAKFTFKAASQDPSGHMPGHVSRRFLPVSLDRFAGGFDVALDIKLEAFARANNCLIETRAGFRLRVFRPAADRFAAAVRSNDLSAAAPTAEEPSQMDRPP